MNAAGHPWKGNPAVAERAFRLQASRVSKRLESSPYCEDCMEYVTSAVQCSFCGNSFCDDCWPEHRDGDSHMDHRDTEASA